MNLNQLKYLGLTDGEIKVYQALLENGPQPAAEIITLTGIKKGDCYNKLYDLQEKGLIEEFTQSKNKHFRLVDPRKLEELATSQYQTALQAKREIESTLPVILSNYTLSYHKPGIILFEGEDALRRTLEDSLSAEGDILQITDSEAFDQYLPKEDAKYVAKRLKLGLKKKMIIPDSPRNREYAKTRPTDYQELTQIRFIPEKMPSFKTSMLIYNDKISYQTLKPDSMIGVIIEDPLITLMHKELFEFTWKQALPVEKLLDREQLADQPVQSQ